MAKTAISTEKLQQQLANRRQRQQLTATFAYRRLVLMLAENEEVDREQSEVEVILDNAGKTNDQLFADVDRMRQRIVLVKIREREPEIVRKRAEEASRFLAFIHQRDAEIREMQERHQKVESAFNTSEFQTAREKAACEQALFDLWALPMSEDDERREAEIHNQLAEVRHRIYMMRQACNDHARYLNPDPTFRQLVDREEALKQAINEIRAMRTAIPDLDAEEEAALSELED